MRGRLGRDREPVEPWQSGGDEKERRLEETLPVGAVFGRKKRRFRTRFAADVVYFCRKQERVGKGNGKLLLYELKVFVYCIG